ncbi:MAG: DUF2182 domain-containing protein [Alphaproteobacteria bacterium]|nr:DUF2182 domain-containing protein [Alphaproteobacteria bacterium]
MKHQLTATEIVIKRERLIVGAGLILITLLSWWWLFIGAGTGMNIFTMTTWQFPPPVTPGMPMQWTPAYAGLMFLMWWIMMIAMMTPSAAPMILLYGHAYRHEQKQGRIAPALIPAFAFAAGYLLAWMGFSLLATALQWSLENAGLLHAMTMWSIEPVFTAALLIAAGAYQLTPLKTVCLQHCRSPAHFLSRNFKPGSFGALRMGLTHGAYCLGCCWFLMALLFAGGLMNLVWVAGLAAYVLIEKIAPHGQWIARLSGIALIAAGLYVLALPHIT